MTLVCGEHVLGEVTDHTFENWHNSGTLRPGPDFDTYRPLFDEYVRLDARIEKDVDVEDDAAREARDALQDRFDALHLRLVTPVRSERIHDFHPTDDVGGIYWRWGDPPEPGMPRGEPRSRSAAAAIASMIRKWLARS